MKPILFNTEMVQKILSGEKSVTRRVVKPQPPCELRIMDKGYHAGEWHLYQNNPVVDKVMNSPWGMQYIPPFAVGDILYVRETFFAHKGRYYYKADGKHTALDAMIGGSFFKWRPSIHMPHEAARLFLRVTDVRVEQLWDITERGPRSAKAEGFANDINLNAGTGASASKHFHNFWNSTIKKADLDRYGWDANPWVWVIEFERCEKPEGV